MGRKTKVGKQRKDKFYHLAKETGYRSRAAFKLIQLNRKYEFLQKSKVLVDLCAAPGGWLQVASKYMPVSSIIIGVDLVPIKPIPNVLTFQEDITTSRCQTLLKKELKTWKVDVFLNDGAPNVGKSWLHDAYAQNVLTLQALKLATQFLVRGGWFVTKVFRSKDYNALIWVLKKLFKKVSATKPQASRHESAEIFIVCQHYIHPDKIDPRFLDPTHLFGDIDTESKPKLDLNKKKEKKVKAQGYPEGDYTLFHSASALDFVNTDSHLELLATCNEIVIDDERILNHSLTTDEIKECCKDIRVLGKSDLKALLIWKKKMKAYLNELTEKAEEVDEVVEDEEDEELKLLKLSEDANAAKAKELKKKKKKVLKQRKKLHERLNLQMVLKNDQPLIQDDDELFKLKKIKSSKELSEVDNDQETPYVSLDSVEPPLHDNKPKIQKYSRDEVAPNWYEDEEADKNVSSSDEEFQEKLQFESDSEDDEESDEDEVPNLEKDDEENPLIIDLEHGSKKNRINHMAKQWFERDAFADTDEEEELLEFAMIKDKQQNKRNSSVQENTLLHEDDNEDIASDAESMDEITENETLKDKTQTLANGSTETQKKKKVKLDPEGLALGSLLIQSKKKRREIIEYGFNRYSFGDENLPSWFVEDEKKHYSKPAPVTPDMIEEYKAKLKEINARPIKKVAEAKARKKKRALKRLEKARQKAEAVTESTDMSEQEKAHHIKGIYKKALKGKKEDVTYIVAKKGVGRKVRRPKGVKGRFKVVDPRMKKDKRTLKKNEKKFRKR